MLILSPDYLLAYYQACKGASPIRSGAYGLAMTLVLAPSLIIGGASITVTKSYRVQLWLGWAILLISMGLFSSVRADTPLANVIGYSPLVDIGGGLLYAGTYFPVLAPLPTSENAHALALFSFFRLFASVSGFILLNGVHKH